MKLEQKVTSQELSEKIWDLGWRIETEFSWVDFEETDNYVLCNDKQIIDDATYNEASKVYPAPLACEIIDVLPDYIAGEGIFQSGEGIFQLTCLKFENDFTVKYQRGIGIKNNLAHKEADTPANALCKMLKYLTKEGIMKPEEK